MNRKLLIALFLVAAPAVAAAGTTEFCLDGEFNLGARYQGIDPDVDEFVATRWCVVSDDDTGRAALSIEGKSNPDMEGGWAVAFMPPDRVRIVNAENPPDVEFRGADSRAEAQRIRRIDPRRLVEELDRMPLSQASVSLRDGRVEKLQTSADLPLRGRVPVLWEWDWADIRHPELALTVDGSLFFRARGSWRDLPDDEAERHWRPTPGVEPVQVPGEYWPSRVNMQRVELADGVYLVRGVRTGFQHLVVDTSDGLVVADAPAGWVELHQLPPADLVPGLGISGLSERLVDFLAAELPGRPIRAVALTHAHDDHAGGARAFAAEGAEVFAPASYAAVLESALNRDSMPDDRLSTAGKEVKVTPVFGETILADETIPVSLLSIGSSPHSSASLGVLAAGYFFVSDLHVPRSDADAPRTDRAATECWFAGWAVASLPAGTVVLNSHSTPQTPLSRLSSYLQSTACRSPG